MPFINVKALKGLLSTEEKAEVIAAVTDAMVRIKGERLRGGTWVVIEDVETDSWGIAGEVLHVPPAANEDH